MLLCLSSNHQNASFDLLDKLSVIAEDTTLQLVNSSDFVTGAVVNTDGGTGTAGGWFWSDAKKSFVNRPDGLG